ncbi:acyltransferase [Streptacidiphilus pinicola]|uniref:Acyltransferase n=1 Tax=Streptacidiphilus pinicola TaxID=2219663 RepID=A0A2X0JAX2_9ACTN|nr:acyltransferase [Streptacidiphilus pinicola]
MRATPQRPERPAQSTRRPRLYVLDGLRLVAALGVLSWHWMGVQRWPDIWHGTTAHLMPAGHALGSYGWLGVELFFLISGFVICMSCWGRSVGDFVTSRVTRLFPAYWVAVLLTSAVLYFAPHRWGNDTSRPSLMRVLTNLSMAHAPLGVNDIDAVYWTLWIELRFYIIFGVVVAMGLTYRRVLAFCGVWGFLSLISASVNFPLLDAVVQSQYSWYFIAGMAFFLMYRFGQNLLLWGIVGFCWLMALNRITIMLHTNEYGAGHPLSWKLAAGVVTLSFALVGLAAVGAFNRINWRWLTVAGALTYPLYLIHQEIGFELITRLSRYLPPYPTVAVSLAIMLTVAYALHRLVERPFAPLLKRGLAASFAAVRRNGEPAQAG